MSKRTLVIIIIVTLAILAYVNYTKRIELARQLQQLSGQLPGDEAKSVAQAKAIIEKVKRHIMITGNIEPTVATIVDVDTLKKRNDFYKNAKNGDYLVVTPTRAVLYSPDKDIILDVVPVQLEPNVPQKSSSSSSSKK